MIDFREERIFPLGQAPREAPPRRPGKPLHKSTFHRWATIGCKGVRLETLQVGGTRCTSAEALQRFFDRLSSLRPPCRHVTDGDELEHHLGSQSQDETDRLLHELGL